MKNALLAILLFSSVSASAQFVTGQNLLGAQVSFGTSNSKLAASENGNTFLNLNFSLQKFTTPTLLHGIGVGYGYQDARPNGAVSSYSDYFSAFYTITRLMPLGKQFYFTYGGNITGAYSYNKNGGNSINYIKSDGVAVTVSGNLGLLYQLTPRLVLTGVVSNLLSLRYAYTSNADYVTLPGGPTIKTNVSTTKNFGFQSGLNNFSLTDFTIGVSYVIKNKR